MPIVCALVPSYKVEVARLERPGLRDAPVLVVDKLDRGRVLAVDAAAHALGARVGATLLQAAACAREAVAVVDDPARNRALWERALDALDAASPLVEDAGEGVAYLEMRGIPQPQCWLDAVRDALAPAPDGPGLPFSLALAANKFVARAAALSTRRPCTVRAGDERAFLAPLPLRVLAIQEAAIDRLHLLGVRTLGDLAALPHGPFVRRFGPQTGPVRDAFLAGRPPEVIDRLHEYQARGADWVNIAVRAPIEMDVLENFAGDVLPAFR